jgi:hypothetical protein
MTQFEALSTHFLVEINSLSPFIRIDGLGVKWHSPTSNHNKEYFTYFEVLMAVIQKMLF